MRAILTALLMFAATSAWAEWTKVGETLDGVYYLDPASVSASGNLRRVWVIQDYLKPAPNGARSRRSLFEIDCVGERLRRLAGTEHSEPMGDGKILNFLDEESDWIYVAPVTGTNISRRTPQTMIIRFVC